MLQSFESILDTFKLKLSMMLPGHIVFQSFGMSDTLLGYLILGHFQDISDHYFG